MTLLNEKEIDDLQVLEIKFLNQERASPPRKSPKQCKVISTQLLLYVDGKFGNCPLFSLRVKGGNV